MLRVCAEQTVPISSVWKLMEGQWCALQFTQTELVEVF